MDTKARRGDFFAGAWRGSHVPDAQGVLLVYIEHFRFSYNFLYNDFTTL
jgi:hypothetical protein